MRFHLGKFIDRFIRFVNMGFMMENEELINPFVLIGGLL